MTAPTPRQMIDQLADANEETMLLADGFDDAILGLVRRCGQLPIVIYDRAKCIQLLIDRDGMTREDAEEYFEFNVSGAWVGEGTPGYLEALDPEDYCEPETEVETVMDPASVFQIQLGMEPTYPVRLKDMTSATAAIPKSHRLGVTGECRWCGHPVESFLCNNDVVVIFPWAAKWDYMAACSNPECKHNHGEGYFQDLPSWVIPTKN